MLKFPDFKKKIKHLALILRIITNWKILSTKNLKTIKLFKKAKYFSNSKLKAQDKGPESLIFHNNKKQRKKKPALELFLSLKLKIILTLYLHFKKILLMNFP